MDAQYLQVVESNFLRKKNKEATPRGAASLFDFFSTPGLRDENFLHFIMVIALKVDDIKAGIHLCGNGVPALPAKNS